MDAEEAVLLETGLRDRYGEANFRREFFAKLSQGWAFLFAVVCFPAAIRPNELGLLVWIAASLSVVNGAVWLHAYWEAERTIPALAARRKRQLKLSPEQGYHNALWRATTSSERKKLGLKKLKFVLGSEMPDVDLYEGGLEKFEASRRKTYLITRNDYPVAIASVLKIAGDTVWGFNCSDKMFDGSEPISLQQAMARSKVDQSLDDAASKKIEVICVGLASAKETTAELAHLRAAKMQQTFGLPEFVWAKNSNIEISGIDLGRARDSESRDSFKEQRQRAAIIVAVSRVIDAHNMIDFRDTLKILVAHSEINGTVLANYTGWSRKLSISEGRFFKA